MEESVHQQLVTSGDAESNPVNIIDVEKVIASKSPGLAKFIPGFVVRYLKRIIHQDEINAALIRFGDLRGLDFIDRILEEFGVDIRVTGIEKLSLGPRFLLASNHPLGGLDGMALMKVAGSVRKDIVFPVNDLLMNVTQISGLFIPINKHGSNVQNVRIIEETFASDKAILYFPAGLCSRKIKGRIVDLEWKKSFITQARKHKRDIIPVYIEGRNSDFFYRLANIRKMLHIRTNIEMLYLPDEMFRQKNKVLHIHFGDPIPWMTFDKRYKDDKWAGLVRQHVYNMAAGPVLFDDLIRSSARNKV